MTKKEKELIMRGILAGYEAMIDESIPKMGSQDKGRKGSWNALPNTRESRGMSREQWDRYQRHVDVWVTA